MEDISGPRTTHPGGLVVGPHVWMDILSKGTAAPPMGTKTKNRNAAVTCVLVAILGSLKSFVCCYESAFSCPYIQPSVLLNT